jgi:thiamine biosynthesis lipoprotein
VSAVPVRTEVLMGTLVTIHVVRPNADDGIERAFGWFREIESRCSRFDQQSELVQLTMRVGEPVIASPILFEAVRFAVSVAEETSGAFDPTVGHRMEARGFNREDRTGRTVRTSVAPDDDVSYRDIEVDVARRTISLRRPLLLDLGAVAKGLAIDAATRELSSFKDFAIDAGGDLYLGGLNPRGEPWSVGIRHPRIDRELIDSVRVSYKAVCTSGDYERVVQSRRGGGTEADRARRATAESEHHILDPRTGASPSGVASVTVVGPNALLADALATAAFVLGPAEGLRLLERHGVEGLIVTPALERIETSGLPR